LLAEEKQQRSKTMTYKVRIGVRERGAIGSFSGQDFNVVGLTENATRSEVFQAWQEQYGEAYEPFVIHSFTPVVAEEVA
jgi:hypothetical protein